MMQMVVADGIRYGEWWDGSTKSQTLFVSLKSGNVVNRLFLVSFLDFRGYC